MDGFITNVRFCEVLSVEDWQDGDKIKVRLHPEDDAIEDSKLEYAFPLLPKMLHVKPKVGEAVLVLLAMANNANSQRYYIGPVITQDQKLYKEGYINAQSFMKGATTNPEKSPGTNPDIIPTLPKDDDVVIRGRKNADIQITDDDVRIKAGVKKCNERNKEDIVFNEENPAYLKIKYHPEGLVTEKYIEEKVQKKVKSKQEKQAIANKNNGIDVSANILQNDGMQQRKNTSFYKEARAEVYEELGQGGDVKQCNSTATIVADKINLLSNHSNEVNFKSKDKEDLINDEELINVLKDAYKLPYGEKLVEILSKFIDAFVKHTHPFMMMPPVPADGIPELIEKKATLLDNKELLSDTVRIN